MMNHDVSPTTHRQASFVFWQWPVKSSAGWSWRLRTFGLFGLQKHNALFQVEKCRFSGSARGRWGFTKVGAFEAVVMEVGPEINVFCVVHLNEDVARLRGDLKKSFLEIVRCRLIVVVVVILCLRAPQMNVVPKARRHFCSLILTRSTGTISLSWFLISLFIDYKLMTRQHHKKNNQQRKPIACPTLKLAP